MTQACARKEAPPKTGETGEAAAQMVTSNKTTTFLTTTFLKLTFLSSLFSSLYHTVCNLVRPLFLAFYSTVVRIEQTHVFLLSV